MSPDPAARRRAALLVLGAGSAWAVVEAVAGPVLGRYSPYQVVWSRYAIHLLVVLAWMGRSLPWRTRRPGLQLLASLCMLAMPHYFVVGARVIGGANAWAFFWVSPLLALAIGWLALGERPTGLGWLVSAACFGASLLVFGEKPFPPPTGLAASLAMAFSFAAYVVLLRMLRGESLASKLFYTALGVFLALTPVMPRLFVFPDGRAAVALLAVALLGLVFLTLFDCALETATVANTAPFHYGLPLCHVVIVALLGHGPGRRAMVGALVLAIALAVAFRGAEERADPSPVLAG